MAGLTILVTGVTRYIGSALAGRLASTPGVDRVIGVDAAMPEPAARTRMGAADFARADIRNPSISRLLDAAEVDTVVHASASATPASSAARTMAKEMNVLGTMQLLAACQRSTTLRSLIVRSTAAVYGASVKDPAVLTEDMTPHSVPATGAGRDAVDIEGYVRGFARRRPDVRVAVPRFAEIIGPTVRTPLSRLFSLSPVVPMLAGRDARLQLVHEADAVAVMETLALGTFSGVVNVAGDGALTVAQAVHRAGRFPLPVPDAALDALAQLLRLTGIGAFSPQLVRQLSTGRVLDTTRLIGAVGFRTMMSTAEAFDDFARTLRPALDPRAVRRIEVRLAAALGARPAPEVAYSVAAQAVSESAGERAEPYGPGGSVGSTGRPRLMSIDGQGPGGVRRRGRR